MRLITPQTRPEPKPGVPHSARILLLVAVMIAVALYGVDALIQALLHHRGGLVDQLIRPDFSVLLIRLGLAALFLALGAIAYVLLLRERSSAEQARMAQSFLSSVIDNIPDMVFIKDAQELRFVRVNPAGERLVGLTEKELLGKSDYDFFPKAQADFFTEKDRAVLESRRVLDIPEEEIDTRRIGRRILHTKKVPILDRDGRPAFLLGLSEDVTERRQAELAVQIEKSRAELEAQRHQQELAHIMRLSTLGEMASGMAHELNQPLTAVSTYCAAALAMLEQPSASNERVRSILVKAVEQAQRAGDIIRRLRELVRKGNDTKELIDLDRLIPEVISFLEWELRDGRVELSLHLNGRGRLVRADRVQLEQVLINLIRNSMESIGAAKVSGGRIRAETELTEGATIRTRVLDNGPGIDPAILKRLFEPFLTNKERGMGIGLSISRSIIESHGGRLWGENVPAGGAAFGFEMPVAEPNPHG